MLVFLCIKKILYISYPMHTSHLRLQREGSSPRHGCRDPAYKDVKALHPADWIPASMPGRRALNESVHRIACERRQVGACSWHFLPCYTALGILQRINKELYF